jgi:hypothetical protein
MISSVRNTVILSLMSMALAGCSKAPVPAEIVTGRVVFKGKPVADAGIRFYGLDNGYGLVASLDADGRYVTPSPLPVGVYRVSITGNQAGAEPGSTAPPPSPMAPDYVYEAYQDSATSSLEARVSFSQTTFDYDISEPPKVSNDPVGSPVAFPPAKGYKR